VLKTTNGTVRRGHTDERGTREYNLALGERRANSVRDYMVLNGIANSRIEAISYGEDPVAFGSDEASWAQNRRVELVVVSGITNMQFLDKTLVSGLPGDRFVRRWHLGVDYVDQETKRAELAGRPMTPMHPGEPRPTRQPASVPAPARTRGTGTCRPAAGAPGAPRRQPCNCRSASRCAVAAQPVCNSHRTRTWVRCSCVQQLQQQIMLINGRLEEQANELRTLQEQSLQRYVDFLGGWGRSGWWRRCAAPAACRHLLRLPRHLPIGHCTNPASAPAAALAAPSGSVAPAAAQPGEAEAYEAAYALVRSQKFDQAVTAFQQFQRNYPAGMYAPNAYYWLGELYLVVQPPDLESSGGPSPCC
jgi:TolA-binding protein